MSGKLYIRLTILGLMLTAGMACNFLAGSAPETSEGSQSGDVLFQDDFSNTNSGWDQIRDADYQTDYENGGYRIYVNEPNIDVWANPGLNFTDVSVEVDATKIGGPDDNDFGVICRYQDESNFYFMIIASDGSYGIAVVEDGGEPELIEMEFLDYSEIINKGDATNQIRADCVGNNLTLYANGTILADVRDSRFTSGDVGLIAGTFDTPGTEVLFDNFIVRQP